MGTERPGFLVRLFEEHRVFLDAFEALFERAANALDPAERGQALNALHGLCFSFFEDFHHRKEEELLFPLLAADPRIHSGGPECVLHFDFQMQSPPLDAARAACVREGMTPIEPPWPPGRQRWRDEASPLTIPAEDHEAGRILLRAIASLLGGSPTDGEKALRLFEHYGMLQRRHLRKEDGCLFQMAFQLLSPAAWAGLTEKEPSWSTEGLHPLTVEALTVAASRKRGRAGVK